MVRFSYINKPVVLACIICASVFYFGRKNIQEKNPYKSLLKKENVCTLRGKIISSPVRISGGSYYVSRFKINSASDFSGICSSSYGIVKVFIPSFMAEACLPGKIFSHAFKDGAWLYESGCEFILNGNFRNDSFYVNKAKALGYSKNLSGKIFRIRAESRLYFKRLMYSWGNAGGLLTALFTGSKEFTEESLTDAFRKAGLSHILALSGMHLSLFSGIAMFIGKRTHRKKIAFFIRTSVLVLFVWFAGFSPSLTRAFICAVLTVIYKLSASEDPDLFLILCFSFLFQSIICPQDISNAGFILSYTALAGILLLSDYFQKCLNLFMPSYTSASLSSSAGACTMTMPVSLILFGGFAPGGIIATFFISPVITLFIYSGLILIILSLICPLLAYPSGIFVNLQYNLIKSLVMIFARFPMWSIAN